MLFQAPWFYFYAFMHLQSAVTLEERCMHVVIDGTNLLVVRSSAGMV